MTSTRDQPTEHVGVGHPLGVQHEIETDESGRMFTYCGICKRSIYVDDEWLERKRERDHWKAVRADEYAKRVSHYRVFGHDGRYN